MVMVYRPDTLKEAVKLLNSENCTVFAGGTDLMVKRKGWAGTVPYFDKPVVVISEIKEIKDIKMDENGLRIGAGCTFSEIMESRLIPEFFKQVFYQIASPAVRNSATIGGNICNSSPAGDSLPLLYAMDAILLIESLEGERRIPINDFILGPGRNVLRPGEILREVIVQLHSYNISLYKKVGTRKSNALSKLSFMGLGRKKEGVLEDLRIALGAVGPTVIRDRDIEKEIISMVNGNRIDIKDIKACYSAIIRPIDDQRSTSFYRKEVCLRFIQEFILKEIKN